MFHLVTSATKVVGDTWTNMYVIAKKHALLAESAIHAFAASRQRSSPGET